jgi:hypothetical protein
VKILLYLITVIVLIATPALFLLFHPLHYVGIVSLYVINVIPSCPILCVRTWKLILVLHNRTVEAPIPQIILWAGITETLWALSYDPVGCEVLVSLPGTIGVGDTQILQFLPSLVR